MSRTGGPRTSAAQHWVTFENSVVNLETLDHYPLPASNRIRIKNRVATGEIPNDHSIWQTYRSWIPCTMLCGRGALFYGFCFDGLGQRGQKGQNITHFIVPFRDIHVFLHSQANKGTQMQEFVVDLYRTLCYELHNRPHSWL